MALFSFKARFADPIVAGTKRQTIRATRKNIGSHGKVGGPISLATGSRFKPRPLGKSVCIDVHPIALNLALGQVDRPQGYSNGLTPRGRISDQEGLNAFAVSDGFADWADLCAFWAENHPGLTLFSGIVTIWGDLI